MTRAELITVMARAMACHFSMNRMPHMSGDPLARLGSQERRRLDDATTAALDAIEAAGWVVVPNADNMTDEQAEAIAAACHVCGGIAFSAYDAALAASPLAKESGDE